MKFKEILAHSPKYNLCTVSNDNNYNDYVIPCNIGIFGVPEDLPIIDGELAGDRLEKSTLLGSLSGYLILCNQALLSNLNIHIICDTISGDLEHAISTLEEDGAPLNEYDGDEFQNIFYIHDLTLNEQHKSIELETLILNSIPTIIFRLYHVRPELLAYYPMPLEDTDNPHNKAYLDAGFCEINNSDLLIKSTED